jgi:hypothetical protein
VDQLTFYLRKRFLYSGSLANVTISLDQILDDGAVYYLNGVEVGRSGIGAGAPTFTTPATRTVGDAVEELNVITAPGTALVNGTNVLAVEVHQVNTTSSDVVFGARFKISVPSQASLVINEVLPAAVGAGFVEIFNPGVSTINLRNHYFTDDPANLQKLRVTSDLFISGGGLASIGFAESGLALSSPIKVYLVATNGTAIVNAVSATMPLDGRSIGRKPAGSANWFLFTEPTRNGPNASQSSLAAALQLNEVHFSSSNTVDWVEFFNSGDTPLSLNGLFLASNPELTDLAPLSGSVPPHGVVSQNFAFPLSGAEVTLFSSAPGTPCCRRGNSRGQGWATRCKLCRTEALSGTRRHPPLAMRRTIPRARLTSSSTKSCTTRPPTSRRQSSSSFTIAVRTQSSCPAGASSMGSALPFRPARRSRPTATSSSRRTGAGCRLRMGPSRCWGT